MSCLYASDYGPPDPAFDPIAYSMERGGGVRNHATEFASARNIGQFEAIERKMARGEAVVWCDQGYGWTRSTPIEVFFVLVLILAVPWLVLRRFGWAGYMRHR